MFVVSETSGNFVVLRRTFSFGEARPALVRFSFWGVADMFRATTTVSSFSLRR